jgi:hypothetical protein
MATGFMLFPTSKGWGLGWSNAAYTERARGFEERYQKAIFDLTPEERQRAVNTINRMIKNAFSK